MIAATFGLDLRRSRSILLWASVIGFIYAGVMALVYPTMRDNAAVMEEYLKIFPKEFMSAFGVTGSLSDPGIFFNAYIGQFLWPVLATRPVGADLDRGFLELVVATPLPRRRYLVVSIVGQVIGTTLVALVVVAGVLSVGALVGAGFDPGRFLLAVPLLAAFSWAIAAFATLLSVITLSRGMAGGLTVGVLLAMYLGHIVAGIVPELDWLARLSIFGYFPTREVVGQGTLPLGDLGVLVGAAVACWTGAVVLFGRRDLAA
jgi:ABC-2 type transport system permease protein